MFLNSIQQLENIEWGKSHYWDVMFTTAVPYNMLPPPPSPFATWFPASEVEENLAIVSSQTIETYLSTSVVPLRSSNFSISLTFFDDDNHTLAQWITNWINKEIFNDGYAISPVSDVVRMLVLVKYKIVNGVKTPIGSGLTPNTVINPLNSNLYGLKAYYVYPDTTFSYQGSSEAGTHTYTVNFMIAGDVSLPGIDTGRHQLMTQLSNGVPITQ